MLQKALEATTNLIVPGDILAPALIYIARM